MYTCAMKILIIRHGESTDDVDKQYGGWADYNLTDRGKQQLAESAKKISNLNLSFAKIIHSPLKRAAQSATVLSSALALDIEESIWLKERNKYGLLTGMSKEFAAQTFPDLVRMLEAGYVYGAETSVLFDARVTEAYKRLQDQQQPIIAVTHGGFLNSLIDNHLGARYKKAGDGGYILIDAATNQILDSDNFELY